jgi:hypothetical protein
MSGQDGKPFAIPKELVWQAWKQVKANGGAAGADGVTIEMFEKDLKDNLYKVWLCRAADYAEWAILGADLSSSGVQVPASDSA